MADKKKDKLFVKRYKTLKEHRAAVAARKTLKGGKNVGPVANAAAYGETMKKKKPVAKKPTAPKKPADKKAKPTKAQTDRFYSSSSKGSIANKEKAKSNFFRSSSGTRGENVPSNPKLKTQPKKKPKKNRRGRAVRRRDDYRLF